jgi:hypothetical protein
MKDKGLIFALCFLVGTGLLAWIIEGWNVYTPSMFGIALFLFLANKYVK